MVYLRPLEDGPEPDTLPNMGESWRKELFLVFRGINNIPIGGLLVIGALYWLDKPAVCVHVRARVCVYTCVCRCVCPWDWVRMWDTLLSPPLYPLELEPLLNLKLGFFFFFLVCVVS